MKIECTKEQWRFLTKIFFIAQYELERIVDEPNRPNSFYLWSDSYIMEEIEVIFKD